MVVSELLFFSPLQSHFYWVHPEFLYSEKHQQNVSTTVYAAINNKTQLSKMYPKSSLEAHVRQVKQRKELHLSWGSE